MVYTKELSFHTNGYCDIIDITEDVSEIVGKSGITEGLVTVSIPGSTASVTTIEYESGVVKDLQEVLEKLVPSDKTYAHDRRWGDGNGFSHVRASLLGPNKSFVIKDGEILLGTWQQIILIDFDNRPRNRTVIVQVLGE
ncbi:MAG: YjbQ family protein [Endomicrobiales bacterium]|nr:YjbQ family protein [Endomicrobiales bacterium]